MPAFAAHLALIALGLGFRAPFGGGVRTPELHSDALEAQFVHSPGLKIVASQPANWERDQGFNVFQNILQAHPEVNALFACSDLMALGAPPSKMSGLVISGGLKLSLVGVAIGLALAVALAQLMKGLVFGISVWDPLTFVSAAAVLVCVAVVASYIPARRAMRVDPIVALRHE